MQVPLLGPTPVRETSAQVPSFTVLTPTPIATPSTQVPFFIGVVELSSIPLAVVDIFHPKKFGAHAADSPCLGALNAACRLAFVVSFAVVRCALFPYIALAQVTPDVVAAYGAGALPLGYAAFTFVILYGMTALQARGPPLLLSREAHAPPTDGGPARAPDSATRPHPPRAGPFDPRATQLAS
eukprot:518317-Prymnesium_polylepis.2